MGCLLKPGLRFAIWLDCDAEMPIDTRPILWVKAMDGHQTIKLAALIGVLGSGKANAIDLSHAYDAIREHMVGWENQGREYDPAGLEYILTFGECCALIGKLMGGGVEEYEFKKKLESPQ